MKTVGPSPLPDNMYAARHMPVQRVFFWLGRTLVMLAIVSLLLSIFIVSLYRFPGGKGLLYGFSNYLPLPALKVDGKYVPLSKYRAIHDGWIRLYESQGAVDFANSELVSKRVEDKLIREIVISNIIDERDIDVEKSDIDLVYGEFVEQYQSEAHMIESIDRQFGWNIDEFMEFIVTPLAKTRVLDSYVSDWGDVQSQPRSVMEDIHMRVFSEPDRFAEIANDVSTSLSASDGGELGLRPIEEYPIDARDALLSLDIGELSSIIDLESRFVVYKILERKEKYSGFFVNAREIAIDKRDVYDVVSERLSIAEIEDYMK